MMVTTLKSGPVAISNFTLSGKVHDGAPLGQALATWSRTDVVPATYMTANACLSGTNI